MAKLKQWLLIVGLFLLLSEISGAAPVQGLAEGWQVYTWGGGSVQGIALEAGGALSGGHTSTATHGGVLYSSDSEQLKSTTVDDPVDNWGSAIVLDAEGQLWSSGWAMRGGVSVLNHSGFPFDRSEGNWATFTTADGLVDNQVYTTIVDERNQLWFGTWGGMNVLDDGGTPFDKNDDMWNTFTRADGGMLSNPVGIIAPDERGWLWLAMWTEYAGVSVVDFGGTPFDKDDDIWTTFNPGYSLPSWIVEAIAVDGAGRLWFGTVCEGLHMLDCGDTLLDTDDDIWVTFTTDDGLASDSITAALLDSMGYLWLGTDGGVNVLDDGGTPFDKHDDIWASFTTTDGLVSNKVTAFALDGMGRLWIGTDGGVSVLDNGGTPFNKGDDIWATFTAADGLVYNEINTIAVDTVGRLWFGTHYGASMLTHGGTLVDKNDDNWTTVTVGDGLPDNIVTAITTDGRHRLWFGTVDGVGEMVYKVYHAYLHIILRTHPWDEGNDHWHYAHGPLNCGRTYEAYPEDTDDYYYFELQSQTAVTVVVKGFAPTSSNGSVVLYGPANENGPGSQIDYYAIRGVTSMFLGPHLLEPGKYYVRVYTAKNYSDIQPYHLTLECSTSQ